MAETESSQSRCHRSLKVAARLGHTRLQPPHVLLSLLEPPSVRLRAALLAARVSLSDLRQALEQQLSQPESLESDPSPTVSEALAALLAPASGEGDDDDDRLAESLLGAEDLAAGLRQRAIDVDLVRLLLQRSETLSVADFPACSQYTEDVTEKAEQGKLDTVLGRDSELRQVVEILTRRLKNNPLLVGEPGVGKTALVEGLAQRIVERQVPEPLLGCRVLSLDVGRLLAGTRYRGEFEDRVERLLSEIASHRQLLLFVDEIHMLIGAGAEAGAADAANLLKPALARGTLRCLGATTPREFRTRFEKDAALSRRFQQVRVAEPDVATTLTMLRGLKPTLEAFHRATIGEDAVQAAVRLSHRFVPERRLPDKAIDLLDQAGAALNCARASRPAAIERLEAAKLELETAARGQPPESEATNKLASANAELQRRTASWLQGRAHASRAERLRAQLQQAATELSAATLERDYAAVAKLQHHRIPALESELQAALSCSPGAPSDKPSVGAEDVARVVARATGIPVEKLGQAEAEKLQRLEATLAERVVGQPRAVREVSQAVRRARAHLKPPGRPIAGFLLVGPTGVGKTQLCKAIAEFLFGDERALLRLDMSEYQEKHSVARLIGAPPGYVGHESGGELTNAVRRRPFSVVLLDEVEKAHPDIFHILLQLLDEGQLMDGAGVRVDFKNSLVMLTSNLGANDVAPTAPQALLEAECLAAVRQHFRAELLNRLDSIVVFHRLGDTSLCRIAGREFDELAALLAEQEITLEVASEALDYVARNARDPQYGARPLRRFLVEHVHNPIADRIVMGELRAGATVRLSGALDLSIEPAPVGRRPSGAGAGSVTPPPATR